MSVTELPPAPPGNNDAEELARIQAELAQEQARKSRSPGFVEQKPTGGGSMATWLIAKGVVKNEQQATMTLVGVCIVCFALSMWFIFH